MKVTVKAKPKPKQCGIPYDDIPVGYVYIAGSHTGPIALKLVKGNAVLLANHPRSIDWFEITEGFKGVPAYKILGKLTEIVVKEV